MALVPPPQAAPVIRVCVYPDVRGFVAQCPVLNVSPGVSIEFFRLKLESHDFRPSESIEETF